MFFIDTIRQCRKELREDRQAVDGMAEFLRNGEEILSEIFSMERDGFIMEDLMGGHHNAIESGVELFLNWEGFVVRIRWFYCPYPSFCSRREKMMLEKVKDMGNYTNRIVFADFLVGGDTVSPGRVEKVQRMFLDHLRSIHDARSAHLHDCAGAADEAADRLLARMDKEDGNA